MTTNRYTLRAEDEERDCLGCYACMDTKPYVRVALCNGTSRLPPEHPNAEKVIEILTDDNAEIIEGKREILIDYYWRKIGPGETFGRPYDSLLEALAAARSALTTVEPQDNP